MTKRRKLNYETMHPAIRRMHEVCDELIKRGEAEPPEAFVQRRTKIGGTSREYYIACRSRHWSGMWPEDVPWPFTGFFGDRANLEWFAMFGDAVHSRPGNEIPTIKQIGHLRLVHSAD